LQELVVERFIEKHCIVRFIFYSTFGPFLKIFIGKKRSLSYLLFFHPCYWKRRLLRFVLLFFFALWLVVYPRKMMRGRIQELKIPFRLLIQKDI